MSQVTSEMIKKLREMTGAGMMDCKSALSEAEGSMDKAIEILRKKLKAKPRHLALLPDVEIFHKSADWALRHREFFDPKQIAVAKEHVLRGMQRAQPPQTTARCPRDKAHCWHGGGRRTAREIYGSRRARPWPAPA